MQDRHKNKKQYFTELANTTREYYLKQIQRYVDIKEGMKVLEIGCGEGGNLLPFAELGCNVTGIDISDSKISNATAFFKESGYDGTFISNDFMAFDNDKNHLGVFDIVIVRDVIEHIECQWKENFMLHIKKFITDSTVILFCFPAWQNPFGGHQQMSVGFAGKLPFIHLLPNPVYKKLLQISGNSSAAIDEFMEITRSKMPVESFEKLLKATDYAIVERCLWFINPHYKQKFNLTPRKVLPGLNRIKWLRNFYTTSAVYVIKNK